MILPKLLLNKNKLLFLIFPALFFTISYGIPPAIPEEIHYGILNVNERIFNDDIEGAEIEAKKIIKKRPDNPAGYFCMALVIDSWMLRYQSDEKENDFYRFCNLAIEKGEKILNRQPDNVWAKFFIGGSDGLKGIYEARYERWITAFRYGWKGVSVLLQLLESNLADIYYGIGSYNYWRSALSKMLWWMPGIEDKRGEGINQLLKARTDGIYTKTLASVALIDIFLNEKQYYDALKITDEELSKYPSSLVFLWGKARALYGLNRYDESIYLLRKIIKRIELDKYNNYVMLTMCHLYLIKIFIKERKYIDAVSECNTINSFKYEPKIKKHLDGVLNELKTLYKQALQLSSIEQ